MKPHRTLIAGTLTVAALVFTPVASHSQEVMRIEGGNVGIGTSNPTKLLHIRNTTGFGAGFRLEESGGGVFNSNWFFTSIATGAFQISETDGGGGIIYIEPGQPPSLLVLRGGRIGINQFTPVAALDVNGAIASRSSIVHPDYVFEPDYDLESIEDHAEYMWTNKHLPALGAGQYDDEGRAVINFTERSQAVLEELEKAHVYIDLLNRELKDLKAQVATLLEAKQD